MTWLCVFLVGAVSFLRSLSAQFLLLSFTSDRPSLISHRKHYLVRAPASCGGAYHSILLREMITERATAPRDRKKEIFCEICVVCNAADRPRMRSIPQIQTGIATSVILFRVLVYLRISTISISVGFFRTLEKRLPISIILRIYLANFSCL